MLRRRLSAQRLRCFVALGSFVHLRTLVRLIGLGAGLLGESESEGKGKGKGNMITQVASKPLSSSD